MALVFSNTSSHMEVEMTTFSEQVSFNLLSTTITIITSLAIDQSGSFYDEPCNWNISSIREARYQTFLNKTGCENFSCLRSLDNEILFNVSLQHYDQFLPSIDGNFMTAHPVELFNQAKQISVPLLMGGKFTLSLSIVSEVS